MGSAGEQALTARPLRQTRSPQVLVTLGLALAAWLANPLAFIAEDSYFYAVVARNLATTGVQSFWGGEPTNGVHPLWLYLLTGWDWLIARVSPATLFNPAFGVPLSLALLAIGATNWVRVAAHAKLPLAPLLLPQLAFLVGAGVLYSEAHAAFAAHGWLLRLACEEHADQRPRPLLAGVAAAAVLLSRLDGVFYVAAFAAWYVWRHAGRTALAFTIALAVPAAAYALANHVAFGALVPVSGYLKSTFPRPVLSGWQSYPGGMVAMLSGYSVPFGWIPLAVGTVVCWRQRRTLSGTHTLLVPLLLGTAGHALYTSLFTAGFTFWYWYYVLPLTLLCWSTAIAVARVASPRTDAVLQWLVVGALAAVILVGRLGPVSETRAPGLRTTRVLRTLGIDDATILVSEWPGTPAFFTRNRIIAADLLTANRRLVERVTAPGGGVRALASAAAQRGLTIDYVIYNGGMFLVPDADYRELTYHDPRMAYNRAGAVLDRTALGAPLWREPGVAVWRAPGALRGTH